MARGPVQQRRAPAQPGARQLAPAGAQPAGGIYAYISLIAAAYWFAYFLVILPLLGVIEKPLPQPATIEDDFNAHYSPSTGGTPVAAE